MSSKPSILIVEDSKSVTLLLNSYLNKLGYSDVHTCDNGYSAIKKFKKLVKENPDYFKKIVAGELWDTYCPRYFLTC